MLPQWSGSGCCHPLPNHWGRSQRTGAKYIIGKLGGLFCPTTQNLKGSVLYGGNWMQLCIVNLEHVQWTHYFRTLISSPEWFIVFAIEEYPGGRARARVDELIVRDGGILMHLSLKMWRFCLWISNMNNSMRKQGLNCKIYSIFNIISCIEALPPKGAV